MVGVHVSEQYQTVFLAERSSSEKQKKNKKKRKIEEHLGSERRCNFGENGDQRRERWRKTLLHDISVSEGEMKILRKAVGLVVGGG